MAVFISRDSKQDESRNVKNANGNSERIENKKKKNLNPTRRNSYRGNRWQSTDVGEKSERFDLRL